MKKIFTLLASFWVISYSQSQNIGIGTTSPNTNAALEIKGSSKGILIPRMDSVQRKNIPNTKGLMVYDSTYNSFWYNTGTEWQRMAAGSASTSAVLNGKSIGDMLYWNGTAWTLVPVGLPGQAMVLSNGGLPRWGAPTTDTSSTGNAYFFSTNNNSAYKYFLGLLYARYAAIQANNNGGRFISNNEPDIDFIQSLFMLQEITTDEAILAWTDTDVQPLNQTNFAPDNVFIRSMYRRIKDIVVNANSFLATTSTSRLTEINESAAEIARIKTYRAEARYLRALAYYYAIDLFGGFEFITEDDPATGFKGPYISRSNLFTYVENELIAIDADLLPTRTNEYGRADKSGAWMLLAKLYLNAQVYIGISKYTECLTNINKMIGSAQYSLTTEYGRLFLADNNSNTAQQEIIFPIVADGFKIPSYGSTTYIIHAAVGGNMLPADLGIDGGWYGLRTRRECATIMDATGISDTRNYLFKNGQSQNITTPTNFNEGYGITKFKNKLLGGTNTNNLAQVSTDFPMFRLADVWLMYAESVLRGGSGGNLNQAVNFMNYIRGRSGAASISASDLTLNYIFEERTREMYWECHRRTDLIRFNKFSGLDYLWQWKGGIINGVSTKSFTNLFPIPASVLAENSNMVQNQGY